jgi:RNA polymerase sigma-70 factor (ECF subfamily)
MSDLHGQSSAWAAADAEHLVGLIRRSAAGDATAFMEFFDATSSRVYSAARQVLKSPATAEKAALAAYLSLWRGSASFDPARRSIDPWILLATLHAVRDHQGPNEA